jgi:predicted phosphoadenosine phosphosulfate sulfurtransferase
MDEKIRKYILYWRMRGYPIDIPDNIPDELIRLNIAPSYKAIAHAILKNDHSLKSLGIHPVNSEWYNVLKRIELKKRGVELQREDKNTQCTLF